MPDDTTRLHISRDKHARLKAISAETGLKLATLADALVDGWDMLTSEQRVRALYSPVARHANSDQSASIPANQSSSVPAGGSRKDGSDIAA